MLQFEDNAEQRPNAAALGLQSVADTVPSITATTLAALAPKSPAAAEMRRVNVADKRVTSRCGRTRTA